MSLEPLLHNGTGSFKTDALRPTNMRTLLRNLKEFCSPQCQETRNNDIVKTLRCGYQSGGRAPAVSPAFHPVQILGFDVRCSLSLATLCVCGCWVQTSERFLVIIIPAILH